MQAFYASGMIVTLVSASLALFTGTAKADAIASALVGYKEPPTTIAQAKATAPPVTTTSRAAAIALAKHLKRVGAKMYGAYWCPHCHEQLQLFGRQATLQLPYVECAEDGKNARPDLCRTAKIEGYPTWKIKGKTYLGAQSLEALAKASGYQGPRSF